MLFKVTSKNRGAAKRLLNTWHDSKEVRNWTVDQLKNALYGAVNRGLITANDVAKVLAKHEAKQSQMDEDATISNTASESVDDTADTYEQELDSEDASESESGSDNENEGEGEGDAPNDPPPLDSEQPYVTHPELEIARKEDREYAEQTAQNVGGMFLRKALSLVKGELKTFKKQVDSRTDMLIAKLADDMRRNAKPAKVTITHAETRKKITVENPHEMFEQVLRYVSAGLNVALVGPAGCGKTYLTSQIAKALDTGYYSNGALLTKFDLIGYCDVEGNYHGTPAYDAYTKGGLHVFDELDASSPEAVVAFNGMTDGQETYTFPNGAQKRHKDYRAIACMNTYGNGASSEYVGRFRQDAAAMNRYLRIAVDYDTALEISLASEDIVKRAHTVREACTRLGIKHIVSTRTIVYMQTMRDASASKGEIDAHCLFAGLEKSTIKQIANEMEVHKPVQP